MTILLTVGHVSPTQAELLDRLAAAGVAAWSTYGTLVYDAGAVPLSSSD